MTNRTGQLLGDDSSLDLLQKEYQILHSSINNLDARVFQVKGWSITVFSAISILAISDKTSPEVLIIGIVSGSFFWLIDALYKSFQKILISRSLDIERQVNSGEPIERVFYISHSFEDRDKSLWGRLARVTSQMLVFNVAALYSAQIFFCLMLLVALKAHAFVRA